MKRQLHVSCPTPDKTQHRNLRDATLAAATFGRKHVSYEEVGDQYAYQCRCGKWHLTHKATGAHESILVWKAPPAELQEWARTKASSPSE